jgi:uncharacterized iron-regulated membrane protein
MGYLHVCDQCGKTADDIKGWRIVKIPGGPSPLLCSGGCVILWERDQAAKMSVQVPQAKRRWKWRGSSARSSGRS